jgi:SAM-dependent methyltransferase
MALRALARLRRSAAHESHPFAEDRCDSWLEQFHGDELERIDAACAKGSPDSFALFRELDSDAWALLLTQEYDLHPNIRALLPDVPDPSLQALWNGTSGVKLAAQSVAFYRLLRERFDGSLAGARVLDFGCGWGRLARFLARDVEPGMLYGCDPAEAILDVCRESRVPAVLARSEFVPERLPFAENFDLAFSFSVFTHLSEPASLACLRALHAGVRPGGTLIVTVRPPEYLDLNEAMHPLRADSRPHEPQHLFVPHQADPAHPQYGGGEMHYGEAVITLPYVTERWAPMFELRAVDAMAADPYQLVLALRRA